MSNDKIKWDKLETKRTVEIITRTYEEKQLLEGVYACPHCYGSGKAVIGHSFRDGDIYTQCEMCKRTGEIKKCPECNINPIPNDNCTIRCLDCQEIYGKKLRDEFDKRVRESQLEEADV